MLFSFIVPVYNTSKYLERCIESLFRQKGADYEILLIDDGSTDTSGEICDTYALKHLDTVRVIHKENEGLLMTRRRGFKEAKGDWFICIDSDDYVDDYLLKSIVEAIDEYQPDLVMYNFSYSSDEGKITKSRLNISDRSVYEGEEKQFIYSKRLLTDDVNSMCLKAIRRSVVDIDTDYSDCGIRNMCEDAIQVLPLFANAERIVYLSQPLYFYRKGTDSITSTGVYEHWLASKSCFLITEDYLAIWNTSKELKQKFYTKNVERLSNFLRWVFAQNEKDLPKSLSEILHEINTHPAFQRCINMYNKSYSKTSYLKFSIPRIIRYVQMESVNGLKRFFRFERVLKS